MYETMVIGEVGALLAIAVAMAGMQLSGRWWETPRVAVAGSVGLGLFVLLAWVAGSM